MTHFCSENKIPVESIEVVVDLWQGTGLHSSDLGDWGADYDANGAGLPPIFIPV